MGALIDSAPEAALTEADLEWLEGFGVSYSEEVDVFAELETLVMLGGTEMRGRQDEVLRE